MASGVVQNTAGAVAGMGGSGGWSLVAPGTVQRRTGLLASGVEAGCSRCVA